MAGNRLSSGSPCGLTVALLPQPLLAIRERALVRQSEKARARSEAHTFLERDRTKAERVNPFAGLCQGDVP